MKKLINKILQNIRSVIRLIQMIDEKTENHQQQSTPQTQKPQYKKVENYVFSYDWKLGSGSFSEVFKAIDTRNNNTVAIKIIKLQSITSKIALTLLQQQISLLKELQHENVIQCYDVLNSPNNCYIVTQFCKYGDLEKLLHMKRKFAENQISSYVYQIFQGLKYLSTLNIIHRDFKVANVFINESGICKIADFGFGCKSIEQFKDVCLGSPIYMTPQAIMNKQYGPKTDIWAFGALIYELICGRAPLSGIKSQEQLREKIILAPPLINQQISQQLRNFIERCLTISVKNRISISQIEEHNYMKKVIQQNQSAKLTNSMSGSMSETQHTSKSSRLIYKAMENPLSYQQAVSLLQYCRLLSKVCQCVKSPILEQWLLRMIKDLNKTKLRENQMIDYSQFYEQVSSYYNRYSKQFKDKGQKVRIDDALKQCEQLLAKDKKHKPQIMAIGTQTNLLREALSHPLKLVHYAKSSHASKYMA